MTVRDGAKIIRVLLFTTRCAALVFEGMHFFDVGWAVMRGDLARLRRALVPLSQHVAGMTDEELEQWLRGKLQPVR